MILFLDASVVLAACGRALGASRAVFDLASKNKWILTASPYVVSEITHNLPHLPPIATEVWQRLQSLLRLAPEVWTIDRPAVFGPAKDRPVLFTATAWADVLLTHDRGDFGVLMTDGFYSLEIVTPGKFLMRERAAGRLK